MSQCKNFVTGIGRLNRRQFFIMLIIISVVSFLITTCITMLSVFFFPYSSGSIAYYAMKMTVIPSFLVEICIVFPCYLAFFVRRGHDFGVATRYSIVLVVLIFICYLLPGILDLLGLFGEIFNLAQIGIFLLYIFYPGNTSSNLYGNPPINTGNPSSIFRYMKTGSWNITVKK